MIAAPQLPKKGHRDLNHISFHLSFLVILQNYILPQRVLNKMAAAGILAAMRDMSMFQNSGFQSSSPWRVITSHKHWRCVSTMYRWLIFTGLACEKPNLFLLVQYLSVTIDLPLLKKITDAVWPLNWNEHFKVLKKNQGKTNLWNRCSFCMLWIAVWLTL